MTVVLNPKIVGNRSFFFCMILVVYLGHGIFDMTTVSFFQQISFWKGRVSSSTRRNLHLHRSTHLQADTIHRSMCIPGISRLQYERDSPRVEKGIKC